MQQFWPICCRGKASTEEITENGNKWMGEEVMLAFEKYIEGREQFEVSDFLIFYSFLMGYN
jgi:hypothetical protein